MAAGAGDHYRLATKLANGVQAENVAAYISPKSAAINIDFGEGKGKRRKRGLGILARGPSPLILASAGALVLVALLLLGTTYRAAVPKVRRQLSHPDILSMGLPWA